MSKKKYICTYFDFNYLPRGLALFYVIKKFQHDFELFVLTFDEQSYNYLENLHEENLRLISSEKYNSYFNTSVDRYPDKKQYFFSATPNLCSYLFDTQPGIDTVSYTHLTLPTKRIV